MTDIVNPAAPAAVSPLAGKPAPREVLVDLTKLERDYYERRPDTGDPNQLVRFGTSGHRGTSLTGTFTEAHILAITQAICDYRRDSRHRRTAVSGKGHARAVGTGPDHRPRSAGGQRRRRDHPARQRRDADAGHLSRDPRLQSRPRRPLRRRHRHHAVAQSSRGRRLQVQPARRRTGRHRRDALDRGPGQRLAQGRQRRGQAGADRRWRCRPQPRTRKISCCLTSTIWRTSWTWRRFDRSGLTLGVDPLGGASLPYWEPINDVYGLNIAVVNPRLDPTFAFMTVDHDGKIRMDCSSPYAMARLVALKDTYRVAFANDPDADRHGIVTPSVGLMNPNHYLAVAIRYLLTHRPKWQTTSAVGKTVVSSSLIDQRRRTRWAARCSKCRWDSSGSRRGSSTDRAVSAARRAPARASCAWTAQSGRPTRTGRSWICSRLKSRPAPGRIPASTTRS